MNNNSPDTAQRRVSLSPSSRFSPKDHATMDYSNNNMDEEDHSNHRPPPSLYDPALLNAQPTNLSLNLSGIKRPGDHSLDADEPNAKQKKIAPVKLTAQHLPELLFLVRYHRDAGAAVKCGKVVKRVMKIVKYQMAAVTLEEAGGVQDLASVLETVFYKNLHMSALETLLKIDTTTDDPMVQFKRTCVVDGALASRDHFWRDIRVVFVALQVLSKFLPCLVSAESPIKHPADDPTHVQPPVVALRFTTRRFLERMVGSVVQSMEQFPKDAGIQKFGAIAIGHATKLTTANRYSFERVGALPLLASHLQRYSGDRNKNGSAIYQYADESLQAVLLLGTDPADSKQAARSESPRAASYNNNSREEDNHRYRSEEVAPARASYNNPDDNRYRSEEAPRSYNRPDSYNNSREEDNNRYRSEDAPRRASYNNRPESPRAMQEDNLMTTARMRTTSRSLADPLLSGRSSLKAAEEPMEEDAPPPNEYVHNAPRYSYTAPS